MKKIISVFLILITPFILFAKTPKKVKPADYSWRILEKAVVQYDSGNFGDAMTLALKAKESRKQESTYEFYILDKAVTARPVSRVGNHFNDVIKILKERDEYEAVSIINQYLELHGAEFFNENIHNMVNWIRDKAVYPEADFLIGKIYQLEGEYTVADNYYEQAYKNSRFLDIPDQKFEILFARSSIAKESNDIDKYENILTLILSENPGFLNKTLGEACIRTIKDDKAENVDIFFMLYRSQSNLTLNALYDISKVYEKQNNSEEAFKTVCIGTLESFTHIVESLEQRDSDYKYSKLSDFFIECSKFEDVSRWSSENHVWEFFYLLGEKSAQNGSFLFARKIFYDMSKYCPDSYWKSKAAHKLVNN